MKRLFAAVIVSLNAVVFFMLGSKARASSIVPDVAVLKTYAEFQSLLPQDPIKALALADEKLIGTDDPDLLLSIGKAALKAGQPDRAVGYLTPLVGKFPPTNPRLTEVLDHLANAHALLGAWDKALQYELEAFNSAKHRMGGENQALLSRLDALEPKIAKMRPDLSAAVSQMREEIVEGNLRPGEVRREGEPTAVTVWYGTNRNLTDATDPAHQFGTETSDLTIGKLIVTIPENHLSGLIERPSVWSFTNHLDPKKHVVLAKIETLGSDIFAAGCCGENDRLLFVHGYNVSFHDGALRAGQLAHDLEFPGAMLYYSWPSQGSLYGYFTDASNVAPSRPAMQSYLELATRGEGTLNIIAHSMGNQYLLSALESFLEAYPDRKLGQIILAAPDVDRKQFLTQFKTISGRVAGITLYASNRDLALQVSHQVNGGKRLGDAGAGVVQLAGMDTVDASLIETDLLGHSYFGDAPQLLGDILALVKLGWRPNERCGVKARSSSTKASLWDIEPEGCPVEQVRTAGDLIRKFGSSALAEARRRFDAAPGDRLDFWQGVLKIVGNKLER